ncbi:MAG: hypothetical protein ABIQ18_24920 [Umezawaea sp.]
MDDVEVPANRPMPDDLREYLWNRLKPQVAATLAGRRRRSLVLPLSAAAVAVGVLAGGVLVFGPAGAPDRVLPAADPADVRLTQDCVNATIASGVEVPDPESWRPAVKIDLDDDGFQWSEGLVIRTDKAAAVCLVSGRATGGITGPDTADLEGRSRHNYANLTAARPFDGFNAWNIPSGGSIQFGIATDDVVAVSVVREGTVVASALLHDGTFAVKIDSGEMCGRSVEPGGQPVASNLIRATLRDGQVIEGPLCKLDG